MITREQFGKIIKIFTDIRNLVDKDSDKILMYNGVIVSNFKIFQNAVIISTADRDIEYFICSDNVIYQDKGRKRFSYKYDDFLTFIKNNFVIKETKTIDITHLVK